MQELMMSVFCGALFYFLVMQITQCFTEGLIGGIPEEESEDESND